MKGRRNGKNLNKTNGNRKRVPRTKGADGNSRNDVISEGKEEDVGENVRSRDMRTKGAGQRKTKKTISICYRKGVLDSLNLVSSGYNTLALIWRERRHSGQTATKER